MPGTVNFTFGSFFATALDGTTYAFNGCNTSAQLCGYYINTGAGLTKIIDTDDVRPGGTQNFNSISGYFSLDNGAIAFSSAYLESTGGGFGTGIFTTLGGLRLVADEDTAIPGGNGTFYSFIEDVAMDGDEL